MKNIPGKTLVLIAVLVTVTVVLLVTAIWVAGRPHNTAVTTSVVAPTQAPQAPKTATIAFSPASLNMSNTASSTATVDIIASTNGAPITGAQVELLYNPALITNVKFLPPDAGNSLFGAPGAYMNLFTDTKTPGDTTYAVAIQPAGQPVNGTGSIGKVTFTVVKGAPTATINFGKGTLVTAKSTTGSILQNATPLTLKLQ